MNSKTNRTEALRFIKFVGFSISAGVIEIASFTVLNSLLALPYWPSYLTALILSIVWNFTFNRKFTFKSAANVPIAMAKIAVFYVFFTPLSTWWGDALTKIGWNNYVVLLGTMCINFISEFLYDRFVVFRKSLDTATNHKKESATTDTQ